MGSNWYFLNSSIYVIYTCTKFHWNQNFTLWNVLLLVSLCGTHLSSFFTVFLTSKCQETASQIVNILMLCNISNYAISRLKRKSTLTISRHCHQSLMTHSREANYRDLYHQQNFSNQRDWLVVQLFTVSSSKALFMFHVTLITLWPTHSTFYRHFTDNLCKQVANKVIPHLIHIAILQAK